MSTRGFIEHRELGRGFGQKERAGTMTIRVDMEVVYTLLK